jgi:DNA-binding MarR family transcriptional regulator
MNAHFFGTKRAFHSILRVTRRPLRSLGLTAARYDLLYAMFRRRRRGRPESLTRRQSDLRRELGVHRSVVSRMLRSLEVLGLVERSRATTGDQRERHVSLTGAGLERIRDALRCLERASKRLLCMAICFGRQRAFEARLHHMGAYEGYLSGIRATFGDLARLDYPWDLEF